MSWLLKSVGILAFLVCTALAGCRPVFRMYESVGYGNDYVENAYEYTAMGDIQDLEAMGFTGSRTQGCYLGLWMGYQYDRYQGRTTFFSEKDSSVHNCRSMAGPAEFDSLRVVGHPDDFTASAVVTHLNVFNEWGDTTYLEDAAELTNPNFGSMIITGNVEVEIFTESNFEGQSICIGPNNGRIYFADEFEERNHLRNGTELFTNIQDMERAIGSTGFRSFKFGCGDSHQKRI